MPSSPIHKSPSLLACIPFAVGIVISHQQWHLGNYPIYLLTAIFLIIILFQFFKIKRRSLLNQVLLLMTLMAFATLGYLRHKHSNIDNSFEGNIKTTYTATVYSLPESKDKSIRIDLQIDSTIINHSKYAINTKAIAYFEKADTNRTLALLPGDNIKFESTLKSPTKVLNPEGFDYKGYLARKGVFATTYIKSSDWINLNTTTNSINSIAKRVQNHILNILKSQGFEKDELALVSALTVGYKLMLDEEQKENYVIAGSTHILAVSGLHVAILFAFLSKLLSLLGKSRRINIFRALLIVLILWTFAFITGLSPSVTRATLMFSLISLGKVGRQQTSIYNIIFLSAFILLVYNPNYLFDLGFQLSYAAVIAIVTLEPVISPYLIKKLKIRKFFAELMAVSLAAQIGTAPICIHTFNCFPNYFLLTNIWIIPLVGIVVNIALVLIILGLIGIPTFPVAFLLNWLLKTMNFGVKCISNIPYALNTPLYIDETTVALAFAFIIVLTFAVHYHSKKLLFLSTAIVFLALGHNHKQIIDDKNTEKLFVFHDRKVFNICTQNGLLSHIIYSKEDKMRLPQYFINHAIGKHNMRAWYMNEEVKCNNLIKHHDFIITPKSIHAVYSSNIGTQSKDMTVTTLFIDREEPTSIYKLYENFKFKNLVIYRRPEKHINYYQNFCDKEGIHLHKVYEDGAYITGL